MAGAGLFTVGILLAVGVLGLVFGLLGFVLRALGVLAGRGQLAPHQLNSRRAAGAAFVGALCVYVLEIGGWPLDQLPPWVPTVLIAVAVVALLLALAGVVGARERDPSGVVVSLVIAGGGYALLQWQCYVPRAYFGADYLPADSDQPPAAGRLYRNGRCRTGACLELRPAVRRPAATPSL